MKKHHEAAKRPPRQAERKKADESLRHQKRHDAGGSPKDFDRIAKEFHVDYAFHKTSPGHYLLFFKADQADTIQAAFGKYTEKGHGPQSGQAIYPRPASAIRRADCGKAKAERTGQRGGEGGTISKKIKKYVLPYFPYRPSVPQRAEPYSISRRNFRAFFDFGLYHEIQYHGPSYTYGKVKEAQPRCIALKYRADGLNHTEQLFSEVGSRRHAVGCAALGEKPKML